MPDVSNEKKSIIILLGPTGVGKTEFALAVAKNFKGGVVNFDSRQVYRDFPLITAQPSLEEQSACPHRLYGFLGTEQKITAGRFADMCHEAIAQTQAHGLLPILVGGTGLYVKALLEGLAPIPDVPEHVQQDLEQECRDVGVNAMHARLKDVDPDYAAKIHPNDTQRVTRALAVHVATGKSFTTWHAEATKPAPYRVLKIGLRMENTELTPRLNLRIDKMLDAGALDEARKAYELCPDGAAPGWTGIGCAELFGYLNGDHDLEETKELWARNTRHYAKRQMTWFKKDADVHWFCPSDAQAQEDMLALVRAFLE